MVCHIRAIDKKQFKSQKSSNKAPPHLGGVAGLVFSFHYHALMFAERSVTVSFKPSGVC